MRISQRHRLAAGEGARLITWTLSVTSIRTHSAIIKTKRGFSVTVTFAHDFAAAMDLAHAAWVISATLSGTAGSVATHEDGAVLRGQRHLHAHAQTTAGGSRARRSGCPRHRPAAPTIVRPQGSMSFLRGSRLLKMAGRALCGAMRVRW